MYIIFREKSPPPPLSPSAPNLYKFAGILAGFFTDSPHSRANPKRLAATFPGIPEIFPAGWLRVGGQRGWVEETQFLEILRSHQMALPAPGLK